jgi:hypothetical protein
MCEDDTCIVAQRARGKGVLEANATGEKRGPPSQPDGLASDNLV